MTRSRPIGQIVARTVGIVGRMLIAAGVLLLLFVAYQLWGTDLHERAAQHDLKGQFEQLLHDHPSTTTTTVGAGDSPTINQPARVAPTTPAPQIGTVLGQIEIPRIGVHKYVVEGVSEDQLQRGPGHYPTTPLPGQKGNVAIAGHRTTYGAPFANVNELKPGDDIFVTTLQGRFRYQVFNTVIVDPSDVQVLNDSGDNRLTLTACHPKYSAAKRIVVQAKLVGQPAPTLVGQSTGRLLHASLGGGSTPLLAIIGWGLLGAVVCAATWGLSRWLKARGWDWRRWVPYLAGVPLFLLVLFVFFENVTQLLPANF